MHKPTSKHVFESVRDPYTRYNGLICWIDKLWSDDTYKVVFASGFEIVAYESELYPISECIARSKDDRIKVFKNHETKLYDVIYARNHADLHLTADEVMRIILK